MDEQTFWRRMNPARLHALFDAWFSMARGGRREPEPPKKKRSLYEYLRGGN